MSNGPKSTTFEDFYRRLTTQEVPGQGGNAPDAPPSDVSNAGLQTLFQPLSRHHLESRPIATGSRKWRSWAKITWEDKADGSQSLRVPRELQVTVVMTKKMPSSVGLGPGPRVPGPERSRAKKLQRDRGEKPFQPDKKCPPKTKCTGAHFLFCPTEGREKKTRRNWPATDSSKAAWPVGGS